MLEGAIKSELKKEGNMQLKNLVEKILNNSELEDPELELQELPTGTVFGSIISPSFNGKSLAQNTMTVQEILKKHLSDNEVKKIKEITPLTSIQKEVMDDFE